MLSFLKKKKQEQKVIELKAFVSGKVISVEEVPDEVFSKKVLGDGLAIWPDSDVLVAPADGEVTIVMEDSKHACGMKINNEFEILLHIGLDTVAMNGDGFELMVKPGQSVKCGDPLIKFNREVIKNANYPEVIILVVTENENDISMNFNTGFNAVVRETTIIDLK